MDDNTNAAASAPAAATAAPVKPESWTQEIWDGLVEAEQWLVADMHEAGIIIKDDIWPAFKAAMAIFGSQLFPAVFSAISANIADPALIPAAVGTAIVVTASTQGIVDAKQAIASAEAAVNADPAVQALLQSAP